MTEPVSRLHTALADRYRVGRELGQGGMTTVYLAEDPKHHRKVAVKVLRPELDPAANTFTPDSDFPSVTSDQAAAFVLSPPGS